MKTPEIKEFKHWSEDAVRLACIKNGLYTCGSSEDYEHMLSWVRRLYPDTENLYFIAQDIVKHSDGETISNVMFILANQTVTTTFQVEE